MLDTGYWMLDTRLGKTIASPLECGNLLVTAFIFVCLNVRGRCHNNSGTTSIQHPESSITTSIDRPTNNTGTTSIEYPVSSIEYQHRASLQMTAPT
ncbi:MAG: hypothetical protein QF437_00100 [Planctomycetota bacterium]|nr:hypothetical protein [Planctomycetota bacterium]MDP7247983.1 hypothetical protein [Planctomycetota bacterium]